MDSDKTVLRSIYDRNFSRPGWPLILILFSFIAILTLQLPSKSSPTVPYGSAEAPDVVDHVSIWKNSCVGFFPGGSPPRRKAVFRISDFGGVGDGKTSNTETFRKAIRFMKDYGDKGGSQLVVPEGRWLTGSFNLTSNFTLFLEDGAIILGSQVRRFRFYHTMQ